MCHHSHLWIGLQHSTKCHPPGWTGASGCLGCCEEGAGGSSPENMNTHMHSKVKDQTQFLLPSWPLSVKRINKDTDVDCSFTVPVAMIQCRGCTSSVWSLQHLLESPQFSLVCSTIFKAKSCNFPFTALSVTDFTAYQTAADLYDFRYF